MAGLRDIRRRIRSVKNTAQITKAMQMVAASKMRRAQDMAMAGRPYAEQLNKMLSSLSRRTGLVENPLWKGGGTGAPCVLVITTDKGLCGGLNTNVLREASSLPRETVFVSVGRKGRQFLARTGRKLLADFELGEKTGFNETRQVSKFLMDKFLAREIDSVSVLYPKFINTLVQKPVSMKVLPIRDLANTDAGLLKRTPGQKSPAPEEVNPVEYIYEPEAEELLAALFPSYVHFQIFHMVLDSRASEHSARMVAMKTATDNAVQLIKDLTLEYNKARQEGITNEILEIAAAQMATG